MALTEDQLLGLYICIPVYFVLLSAAAFWAHKRMETLVHDKVSDQLSAHYLGGQSFGPLLTAGTVFASIFSGSTIRIIHLYPSILCITGRCRDGCHTSFPFSSDISVLH